MHRALSLRNRRDLHSVKSNYFRFGVKVLMGVTLITLAIAYAFVCSYIYLEPTLPSVSAMKNNELAVPLRVYANSGIPVYFIFNLPERRIEVYSVPQKGRGRYRKSAAFTPGQSIRLPAPAGQELVVPVRRLLP